MFLHNFLIRILYSTMNQFLNNYRIEFSVDNSNSEFANILNLTSRRNVTKYQIHFFLDKIVSTIHQFSIVYKTLKALSIHP